MTAEVELAGCWKDSSTPGCATTPITTAAPASAIARTFHTSRRIWRRPSARASRRQAARSAALRCACCSGARTATRARICAVCSSTSAPQPPAHCIPTRCLAPPAAPRAQPIATPTPRRLHPRPSPAVLRQMMQNTGKLRHRHRTPPRRERSRPPPLPHQRQRDVVGPNRPGRAERIAPYDQRPSDSPRTHHRPFQHPGDLLSAWITYPPLREPSCPRAGIATHPFTRPCATPVTLAFAHQGDA